eukprot:224673-Prymnesium_polylepis.2
MTEAQGTFVDTPTSLGSGQFAGAIALGDTVVFAPYDANAVSRFDVADSTFDASVTTGTLTTSAKFALGAAVGNTVMFTPYRADYVGVFDGSTGVFSLVATTVTGDFKFYGATAVGNRVVFPPMMASVVGVYDTETESFDASVSTGSMGTSEGKARASLQAPRPSATWPFSRQSRAMRWASSTSTRE